jgi:hypothetical protein
MVALAAAPKAAVKENAKQKTAHLGRFHLTSCN